MSRPHHLLLELLGYFGYSAALYMKRTVISLLLIAMMSASCRTKDVRTVEIHVEGMTNETTCTAVKVALLRLTPPGVRDQLLESDDITCDALTGIVTVEYDSMKLAIKNMEHAIAAAGYSTHTVAEDGTVREGVPAMAVKPPAPPPGGTPAAAPKAAAGKSGPSGVPSSNKPPAKASPGS